MGRLLVRISVLAAALYLGSHLGLLEALPLLGGGAELARVEGRYVLLDSGDLEVRFLQIGSPADDAFMVFGGDAKQRSGQMSHATMSALDMRHAELIYQSYPDFHRCASPGAAQAKRLIEFTNFVASGSAARRALSEAVELHDERLGGGGERTCVRVAGPNLSLDRVTLKHDGREIAAELPRAVTQGRFRLAEQVTILDCSEYLR